jgi:methionyl-tRNA formyltransferase
MRLLFFGTPEFAVPSLEILLARGDEVAAVVCQPDRPAGRGQKLTPPPVKVAALRHALPVLQPEKLRSDETMAALRAKAPELVIVAAYGRILPAAILNLPPRGCVNVHASLLPRYRGAAPIQWAILNGDATTGVTIMRMDEGMDTGAMLLQRATDIRPGETYGELQDRLARLGAVALRDALDAMQRGELTVTPQDDSVAIAAPKIEKQQGRIDWKRAAVEIERQVRAFNPWPSAHAEVGGQVLKIHRVSLCEGRGSAGTVLSVEPDLVVACGDGALRVDEVQPGGRQRMQGAAFARGARLGVGIPLG